jgi:hypothetical protein
VENVGHSYKKIVVPCNGRCGFGPDDDCLVEHYELVKIVKNQALQ